MVSRVVQARTREDETGTLRMTRFLQVLNSHGTRKSCRLKERQRQRHMGEGWG